MGHEGSLAGKIRSIEDLDQKVVGTVLEGIKNFNDYRVLVLSDHPTPIILRTHSGEPSPFAVLSSDKHENMASGWSFCESSAKKSGLFISPGHHLMDLFLKGWRSFIEEKHS
jgi:2,3-bisphosphoglycerate-independent phosphoglycerate mutase